MSSLHPAYERAAEERRWDAPLAALFPALRRRAYDAAVREPKEDEVPWAWVILPHGALVALRIRADFRKELRIARDTKPETETARKKWQTELDIFLRTFGGQWEQQDEAPGTGIAARFIELYTHEIRVGVARCSNCGHECPSFPAGTPHRCEECRAKRRLSALARRTSERPEPQPARRGRMEIVR